MSPAAKRLRGRITFEDAPALLTFRQAAELLSVGKNAITEGVRSGHIPTVQLTATIKRIPRAKLAALLGLAQEDPPT